MYDLSKMSIKDINNEIAHLTNQLDYYLEKKGRAWVNTQPKSLSNYDEPINSGKRENKFDCYVITCEELDPEIDYLQDEILSLSKYVEKELKRIGEYEPLMQEIIKCKELQHLTWEQTAIKTSYSVSQCRRIYKSYINKRDI